MSSKILHLLLIITSLIGYLAWGGDNQAFLFEVEWEFFQKVAEAPLSVIHPFTVLPLVGQLLLLVTLFQRTPSKTLAYLAIGGMGLLLGFMFVIGILGGNYLILSSTIPFVVTAIVTIRHHRLAEK